MFPAISRQSCIRRNSHAPLTWAWYALTVPNVDFQWAVPCFLMLSAFVNALSLARSGDVGLYTKRRVQTALLPYVLWSGIYIAVNYALSHLRHLSLGHVVKLLLTGTAHFHLYFFVLVLEMYVLLPLLVPLFQKRPPFWLVAFAAIMLQGGIYVLNRYVFLHRFQSTILWDILPVALGLWLFSQSERLEALRNRGRWAAGVVTLAALAVYSPLAVAIMLPHAHINTALYQIGQWVYTAGMSFLILTLGWALGRNRLTAILAFFGAESLAIYVMHPLAIIGLDLAGLNKSMGSGAGLCGLLRRLPRAAAAGVVGVAAGKNKGGRAKLAGRWRPHAGRHAGILPPGFGFIDGDGFL